MHFMLNTTIIETQYHSKQVHHILIKGNTPTYITHL